MKCGFATVFLLLLLVVCQPVFAEPPVTEPVVENQATEIENTEAKSPYLLPALPYTESPFVQETTTNNIGEIIGSKTGYFHPFLGIGEYYTDNLFNVPSNRQGDFYTRITPGIWVVVPASKYPIRKLSTLNTAPGGLSLSRFRAKGTSRIQAYGGYQADFIEHSRFTSQNHVNQKGEGFFRYNFRGGLSFDLLNIYEKAADAYNTGDSDSLDKYTSNLFNTVISYEISSKTKVEGEYSFFTLSYDRSSLQFRDRDDNSFLIRGFYRFLPKTSALVEYNFISIDYDEDVLSGSDEHRGYLGLDWEQSGKSRWRVMVGAGKKDFDEPGHSNPVNVLAEIQFLHRFTPKTYVLVLGSRTTNETDSVDYDYTEVYRAQIRYYQRLTARFLASVNGFYENTSYKGGDGREDNTGSIGFDLKYTLTNWLAMSGGYYFETRGSNDPAAEYDSNRVYINLIFSL
jgi:hypothetical protein